MSVERKCLYEFDVFRCDPGEQLLSCDGKRIALSPKSFEILVAFIQSNGRLLTKEELMLRVWPDSFVEEANLTVSISALRKALGEPFGKQPFIETVPKRGYRFVVPIRALPENHGSFTAVSDSVQGRGLPEVAPVRKPRWHRWWMAAGLLLIATLIVI